MKQMIILLTTLILGIAISTMILSFKEVAADITGETKSRIHIFFNAE